jgi:hypothetical protein
MWVVGSIFYLVPVVAIAIHLLSPPNRRSSLANRAGLRAEASYYLSQAPSTCCSCP